MDFPRRKFIAGKYLWIIHRFGFKKNISFDTKPENIWSERFARESICEIKNVDF